MRVRTRLTEKLVPPPIPPRVARGMGSTGASATMAANWAKKGRLGKGMAKAGSKLGKVGKVAKKASWALDLIDPAYTEYKGQKKLSQMRKQGASQKAYKKAKSQHRWDRARSWASTAGGIGGGAAGAMAGGLGGIAGGIGGSMAAGKAVDALQRKFGPPQAGEGPAPGVDRDRSAAAKKGWETRKKNNPQLGRGRVPA